MSVLFQSLIATFLVSLISLIGIIFLLFKKKSISKISNIFVSFAVGALLGDALIHLIPESYEKINNNTITSILILSGILLFFSLEKFLRWRHCHHPELHENEQEHLITMNLMGDTVHNFIDGMVIAAGFSASFGIGFATALAVALHEIPQEIGDFGIFLHSGLSFRKALILNFSSALVSLLGTMAIFVFGYRLIGLSTYILPFTAGGFIYLAASDLIPELHRHEPKILASLNQLLCIILGIFLMLALEIVG